MFQTDEHVVAMGIPGAMTGANVLSAGLTGSTHGNGTLRNKVASPLLKPALDLKSDVTLENPFVQLPVYSGNGDGGEVWIGLEA